MVPDYLDCSNEAGALLEPSNKSLCWLADEIEEKHWVVHIPPAAAAVCLAPYFSWRNERLFARANASLIRKGYEVAGVEMDDSLVAALDAIDEVCDAQDLWFEAQLQRGQIQYLNNHEVGHYRSAYEDHDNPQLKRQLYRLWHREAGDTSYDGRHFDQDPVIPA